MVGGRWKYFNPPAPCGAGRGLLSWPARALQFQSTRPVRGGTLQNGEISEVEEYFNPPAPCGAGRYTRNQIINKSEISIHPPRAGRDDKVMEVRRGAVTFQSTRPVRGGTYNRAAAKPQ